MAFDASYLYDPRSWADNEAVHQLFATMRAEDPVHFCESTTHPDLWHVTKHADIFDVERRSTDFLNEPRVVINNLDVEAGIRAETGGSLHRIRPLVAYDGSAHMKLRQLTQSWFMPKNLAKLQSKIDASVVRAIAEISMRGGNCDFASDVAIEFPLRVIMDVLGVPESDYGTLLRLTQELFGPEDPDTRREVEHGMSTNEAQDETINEMFAYFTELTKAKIAHPEDDVASIIANAVIDGEPLDNVGKLGYYIIVATAGHDTTSYSLSEAVHQLAKDPALFARLKEDPETVAPHVTEEAIRYASSVRHFIRTAAHDTTLADKTIREGQSVILWYPSGSRDEDIFKEPNSFNIDRDRSTRHAAFGHGAHMCLGMHLARQEITAFLIALSKNVDALALSGAPRYMQANFVGGIKSLPVKIALSSENAV